MSQSESDPTVTSRSFGALPPLTISKVMKTMENLVDDQTQRIMSHLVEEHERQLEETMLKGQIGKIEGVSFHESGGVKFNKYHEPLKGRGLKPKPETELECLYDQMSGVVDLPDEGWWVDAKDLKFT